MRIRLALTLDVRRDRDEPEPEPDRESDIYSTTERDTGERRIGFQPYTDEGDDQ